MICDDKTRRMKKIKPDVYPKEKPFTPPETWEEQEDD